MAVMQRSQVCTTARDIKITHMSDPSSPEPIDDLLLPSYGNSLLHVCNCRGSHAPHFTRVHKLAILKVQ